MAHQRCLMTFICRRPQNRLTSHESNLSHFASVGAHPSSSCLPLVANGVHCRYPLSISTMLFLDRLIESARSSYKCRSFVDSDLEQEMSFFNPPSHLAPPSALSRKRSQLFSKPPREDIDDFLSSDLEVSFASTVSLHSPPRRTAALPQEKPNLPESMDISPAPGRPRAYTSAARLFGSNIGNTLDPTPHLASKSSSIHLNDKRSAFPHDWIQQSASTIPLESQVSE